MFATQSSKIRGCMSELVSLFPIKFHVVGTLTNNLSVTIHLNTHSISFDNK